MKAKPEDWEEIIVQFWNEFYRIRGSTMMSDKLKSEIKELANRIQKKHESLTT